MKHLSQIQLDQLTQVVTHLDSKRLEAPIQSTRGRKPRAIHNPYFDSELFGAYTTDDLEDMCLGIARSFTGNSTHRGNHINWLSLAKCVLHMPTFTTSGIMQYLQLSKQQAGNYMKALYTYTVLATF